MDAMFMVRIDMAHDGLKTSVPILEPGGTQDTDRRDFFVGRRVMLRLNGKELCGGY